MSGLFIYMDCFNSRKLRELEVGVADGVMDVIPTLTNEDEFSFDNMGNLSHGHCLEAVIGRRSHDTYEKVRKLLWSTNQIPFVAFLDLSHAANKIVKEIEDLRRWFPLAVFVLYCSNDEYDRCLSEMPSEWRVRLTRYFRFPKRESSESGSALRCLLDAAGATARDKVANAQFFSAFISYSHSDQAFARCLHTALSSAGITCWLDEKKLLPGDRIHSKIEAAIKAQDKLLLCASQSSLTSWWVENELNSVIQKEQALWKANGEETLVLIPLNLDGFMFSDAWKSGWKNQIVSRLAPDFTHWSETNDVFSNFLVKSVIDALIIDPSASNNRFSELSR